LDRARGSNPLPEGTTEVGIGLVIAGISAYGFTVVAARALGKTAYAPLSVLWALVFVAGPGFFLPIEQEVSRALAARRARRLGSGPVIRRAALFGSLIALVLLVALLLVSPLLVSNLFNGEWLLFVGLIAGMLGFAVEYLARGTYSGLGRFRPYSVVVGGESLLRFALCVALALAGVTYAGWYGLALGITPALAVLISLRGQHGMVTDGPDAPWSELSSALGALLAGSVLAMVLVNGGPIAMKILAGNGQDELVSQFFTAVIIARIPLFLFQAVQAALLPKLSALASAGKFDEFRVGFRKLVGVVGGVGALAVVAAFVIGPWAIRLLYGPEFQLGHRTVGLLAAGSVLFMLAQAMAQAVIALGGHTKMALCWLVAVVTFVVVTALGSDLYLRVEMGLLVGCAVACLGMALLVRQLVRSGASVHTGDLIEAIHDLGVEA
jgi:O-antigen/teichoic acid export membrane protein